jgi:hypothetical protein
LENIIYCQKEKLALLGTAESLVSAPWDDDEYELWGVAQITTYPVYKRADLLFELHQESYWNDPNIVPRLNRFEGPTYMQKHYDIVPRSVEFPKELLVTSLRRYHTTSVTYMLAWAYKSFIETHKPAHVSLFGIHMSTREEYTEQRPCCEYWLGRMEGAGMSISLSPGGAILSSRGLYGYEGYHPMIPRITERLDGLKAGETHWQNLVKEHERELYRQQGAIVEGEYWLRLLQTGEIPS